MKKTIPIGIEDFKTLIDKNNYFVDKTLIIRDILDNGAIVSLFTRPRRFGKTLNMSMIQRFFEKTDEDNSYLFKGLNIMNAGEQYLAHMGQYPVINISLKSMEQPNFEANFNEFRNIVAKEFERHSNILKSNKLTIRQRNYFERICNDSSDCSDYYTALKLLSDCLYEVYERKVIVLIDEYDVPLQNAFFNGFYDDMMKLIRSAFHSILKTNNSLEFGILTGCLRVSKESIFTGLNNLTVYSVIDNGFSEYFGFTEKEVKGLLNYYQLSENFEELKKWYDGYRFGKHDIYNSWSVLQYLHQIISGSSATLRPYWSNTSSNAIISQFVRNAREDVRDMIEELINGKSISIPIYEDTVYSDIDVSNEHIWSFLLFTGYLKSISTEMKNNLLFAKVVIPNIEVKTIYQHTILQWFKDKTVSEPRDKLLNAILSEDIETIENTICDWLDETISFYDEKEQYYHGFLTGLLSGFTGYSLKSNRESGDGRFDLLLLERKRRNVAVIIEIKDTKRYSGLEAKCNEALKQIEDNRYETEVLQEGYKKIIKYGIAFYKKSCKVKIG